MVEQVFVTEFLKLRRCKVTWATLGGLSLAPLGIALFIWIVREPGRAAELGLVGTKADLSGIEATWPSFFSILPLIVGVGGMILLSFIVAFIFGREYTEDGAKNMLALPVARHWFVLAKLVVALVWWIILVVAVLVESFILGFAQGLPGFSVALAGAAVGDCLAAAAISFLLTPVVSWITTVGRGYLAPVGFALAMLALGDLFGKTGWAVWFPWSIVPLLVGMVGTPETLPGASYLVVVFTFVAGVAATIAQLRYADAR